VIGREHQHERVAITFGREHGGDCNGETGITTHGLEHDIGLDPALT
jgi:hypothetical protein